MVYLFGQAKNADGTNLKKGSVSLEMFWSFYKLFEHDFGGIQERVISALIFTIGDDNPVTLNTDTMMILCCVWLIRCDVLHDRNISSRLAANLSFFLPYACTLLSKNYFQSRNIEQHLTGHRKDNGQSNVHKQQISSMDAMYSVLNNIDDDDDDELKFGGGGVDGGDESDQFSGKELRDKYDSVYRLRKENARIFKTLALYIQQNVIKEEKGKPQIRLADIDINDKNALSSFPMPDWSKINRNFRQTYVGIYDVVSHIATALMASWTMNEPSTLLALGDFCQYLIDVFIPTNAATLANVFSICLLIGDEYLKIGTIKALQLFVPRLFKQCKSMNIFNEVIGCFDETFERCTNLTSDENDRVSQCAHEFIFDLTSKGYKASIKESKLMRSMYPSFKEVDLNDDGMISTITDLTKILNKTQQLLQTYPDNQTIDPKLDRLLHMKPKDNVIKNQNDISNNKVPPRRQSQLQSNPQRFARAANNLNNNLKPQPSFIQKSDLPLQHKSRSKNNNNNNNDNSPQRMPLKPQPSILAEDEENEYDDDDKNNNNNGPSLEASPSRNNGNNKKDNYPRIVDSPKQQIGKHRNLLSTVSAVSGAPEAPPKVMEMGSYRDLRPKRNVTVEKLEDVVDKQLAQSKQDMIAENDDDDEQFGNGKKYKQFGSDPKQFNEEKIDQRPPPPANPNALPYGMDNRPAHIKQVAAAMANTRPAGSGHRKIPTFGASALNLNNQQGIESDAEEDDNDDEIDNEPQQFPKMSSYMPNVPRPPGASMNKDYDPLAGMGDSNVSNNNNNNIARPGGYKQETSGEGDNDNNLQQQPGGVSFDIPPMNNDNSNDNIPPPSQQPQQQQQMYQKKKSKNMDEVPVISNNSNIPVGDLSTFLEDTTLLRTFLKFLKKKTEDYKLLEFYLMAGQFKSYAQDPKSTRSAQRNNAKLIIETFFLPDSKKFLEKIQGMTRHEAMSQFLTAGKATDLEPTLFDRARQEVKSELISRVFPIFMQSDRYKKLVDEGKVRPP